MDVICPTAQARYFSQQRWTGIRECCLSANHDVERVWRNSETYCARERKRRMTLRQSTLRLLACRAEHPTRGPHERSGLPGYLCFIVRTASPAATSSMICADELVEPSIF
jgi:hypothetical protein